MQPPYPLTALLLFFAPGVFAQDSSSGVAPFRSHLMAPPPLHSSQVITDAPYSGEETHTRIQTLSDGTHIKNLNLKYKVYRDSAGRTRVEEPTGQSLPGSRHGEGPVLVRITDPVAHVYYTLDPVNKIAHKQILPVLSDAAESLARQTTPRPAAISAPPAAPAAEGPRTTQIKLDSQNLEGLLAEGTRTTTVYPVDYWGNDRPISEVSEDWRSPELKIELLHTNSDPRDGEYTRKVSNIVRAEPDPNMFRPPADYSIVEEQDEFTIRWGGANGRAQ